MGILVACGGGHGNTGPTAPDASAGPATTITMCGSTTENKGPCGQDPPNAIQFRVNNAETSRGCPCFNFSILNLSLNDIGPAQTTTYEFTGFRQGTYQVSGAMMISGIDFTFAHNATTSAIAVVPSSLKSLSGPSKSDSQACTIGYLVPFQDRGTPANFSFQFTIADKASGGSC